MKRLLVLILILVAACTQSTSAPTPTPTPTRTPSPTADPGALAESFRHVQSTNLVETKLVPQSVEGDGVVILVEISEYQSLYPTLQIKGHVSRLGSHYPDQDPNEALSLLQIELKLTDETRLNVLIDPNNGGFITYISNTVKLSEITLVTISFDYNQASVAFIEHSVNPDKRLWEVVVDTMGFIEWFFP